MASWIVVKRRKWIVRQFVELNLCGGKYIFGIEIGLHCGHTIGYSCSGKPTNFCLLFYWAHWIFVFSSPFPFYIVHLWLLWRWKISIVTNKSVDGTSNSARFLRRQLNIHIVIVINWARNRCRSWRRAVIACFKFDARQCHSNPYTLSNRKNVGPIANTSWTNEYHRIISRCANGSDKNEILYD